jgi:hypothetical protein
VTAVPRFKASYPDRAVHIGGSYLADFLLHIIGRCRSRKWDLSEVWEEHGKDVLTKLAVTDPGKLATIAYGLLPRDVFISVEQKTPGNLEPEAWAALRRVLDLIQAAGADGDPRDVFEMIEEDLRARLATTVG